MDTITMSSKEVKRINILERLKQKEIKQKKAAVLLNISIRQVRRLLIRYRKDGAMGIVSQKRGRVSGNHTDDNILHLAIQTITEKYWDFSVTLAHEKLIEHHAFPYGRETLRKAMITHGIWIPTRAPIPVIHTLRERRPCVGELVQIDGSPHLWFELRGPYCTLLVYIDDATGTLLWLQFVKSESTNAYFSATKHYLLHQGKPITFYSDKHGVFRVNTTKGNSAAVEDSNGLTQFGRAMQELEIETIFANSPEAKGRVEKVNQTLQDRLVKELRLRGINTIEEGNTYLPEYMEAFNKRFAVVPKSSTNMHRPLTVQDNLDTIFVQKHTRVLSKQLTISYEQNIYQIETDHPTYAMRHAPVTVCETPTGVVTIQYKKEQLSYQIITKQPKASIVDSKHINAAVDQASQRIWAKPGNAHPWKQPYLYW